MNTQTTITKLLKIKYPIICGGMVWVSGHRLAFACANAGIMGLIGAGSMKPELLREHLQKIPTGTNVGINIPLLFPYAQQQIEIALECGIKTFFTSAGSPKKYTQWLKDQGCTVVHVTSSPKLAVKCQEAGVDAIVAEGVEAGGHNGREEITTMALTPQVVDAVDIPVIAAGGIGDGRGVAAAFALGASGVQMGTRFVAANESSAHDNFKQAVVETQADSTILALKKVTSVRLIKNQFANQVIEMEQQGADAKTLAAKLGKGRAAQGMLAGDMIEGELEIGQISGLVSEVLPVETIVKNLVSEYQAAISKLPKQL
jgi:enoyl-[acyl-carrier protein] reductase II